MNKQNYEKPLASFIAFYSEKDIASNMPLGEYAGTGTAGGSGVSGGAGIGGEVEDNEE